MPQIKVSYNPALGPLIDGLIGFPIRLHQPGNSAPSAQATFLIDTGSARTFIQPSYVPMLSLQFVSRRTLWTMGGPVDVDIYGGDVSLDGLGSFSSVELCAMPRANPGAAYTAILGRDILNGGMVRIDGRTKDVTIAF